MIVCMDTDRPYAYYSIYNYMSDTIWEMVRFVNEFIFRIITMQDRKNKQVFLNENLLKI